MVKKIEFNVIYCLSRIIRLISGLTKLTGLARIWRTMRRVIRTSYGYSRVKQCGKNVYFPPGMVIWSPQKLTIGDDVSFGEPVHICAGGEVIIGDRVMIASFSSLHSLTHDPTQQPMVGTLIRKKIVIEDDVWIGAGAIILPGVRIGRGAVVGAGAVVSKDVPPFTIVTGVPAQVVKKREVPDSAELT